jgi:hypothetical protein
MPSDTLFGISLQQGGGGQGLSDYLKLTLGYEHLASNNDNFSYYTLMDVGLAVVKGQDALPQEIGGKALPTGLFPTGAWVGGTVSMIPRMDNRFGWLLLAAMGDVSTVADTKAENLAILGGVHGADAGINSHLFWFRSDDQFFVPWVTARRLLPHTTAASRVGETYQDGHVASLTITAGSAAPVRADLAMLARVKQTSSVFDYDPSWGSQVYDDFWKFGVTSCDGHFKVENVEFDVTAVSITVANNLLPPQESLRIGTLHPKDFPNLTRSATVTCTFLVSDWDLYVSTFVGAAVSATDSDIACTIYRADIDVMLASQEKITGTEPYRIQILSNPTENNAAWTVQPVRIVPNRPLVVNATCTITAVEGSGWETHPLFVVLQNDKANYTLPTP